MIFDKLVGLVERYYEEDVREKLRQARLFIFDKKPHDILPKEHDPDKIRFQFENFFLPFPIVAIEDPASCVVLLDLKEDAKGADVRRGYIECVQMNADWDNFEDGKQLLDMRSLEEESKELPTGTCLINIGWFQYVSMESKSFFFQGGVVHVSLASKKQGILYQQEENQIPKHITTPALRNINVAFQELMYFNNPSRFVVEKRRIKTPKKLNKNMIRRSHMRPQYTLLEPKKIREVMGLSEPSNGRSSPRPHERRRHFRTFKDERFKNKKGKTIIIPATWIGPSEATVGNHVYKVRLDL